MVLFIGVTVLLASTYVTINGVDNAALVQESVVKIAQSADELVKPPVAIAMPLTPANKASDMKLENRKAGQSFKVPRTSFRSTFLSHSFYISKSWLFIDLAFIIILC